MKTALKGSEIKPFHKSPKVFRQIISLTEWKYVFTYKHSQKVPLAQVGEGDC